MRKTAFNVTEIMQLLPHKFPFLLLDNVSNVVPGKSAEGYKNFSVNEWFFSGHFPNNPIVPGVLLIESMAQLITFIHLSENLEQSTQNESSQNIGYLAKADIRFLSIVRPGDKLIMTAEIIKKMGKTSRAKVKAMVNKKVVVEGEITVSQQ
ncbi:MAG: 3-hydroxyacyl-ACP dehydratase FabZ [Fibrobacter sp.]|nr:3-hydroxyacyl-ACP dehydratase FabZ [Fibrobacter sp.]